MRQYPHYNVANKLEFVQTIRRALLHTQPKTPFIYQVTAFMQCPGLIKSPGHAVNFELNPLLQGNPGDHEDHANKGTKNTNEL